MFGAGTACVVSPISHIDFLDRPLHIPTMEQSDAVHKMFLKTLLKIQYGYEPNHPWALEID